MFRGSQGTEDEVVDWSHGKRLWELSKEKYEPLWLKGGNHCNLELYPEYLKHLKKFISAVEKLPCPQHTSGQGTGPSERNESPAVDPKDSPLSYGKRESSRASTDSRDKSRLSTERREKARRSYELPAKARSSIDYPERARNSFDRSVSDLPTFFILIVYWICSACSQLFQPIVGSFGDMVRSVGLCNVDCFKQTAHEEIWWVRNISYIAFKLGWNVGCTLVAWLVWNHELLHVNVLSFSLVAEPIPPCLSIFALALSRPSACK